MYNLKLNDENVKNLAIDAHIIATNDSHSNIKNLIDGDFSTYWTSPKNNILNSYIELKFKNEEEFNTIEIQEYIPLGENVNEFIIYAFKNNEWNKIYSGTTIGYKHLAEFPTIKASKLKISFLDYKNNLAINNLSIYKKI